jgi:hypothetical protein
MKHGVHISADKRPAMAVRALEIFENTGQLLDVEIEFDVARPTARNLVGYGRYLREQSLQQS